MEAEGFNFCEAMRRLGQDLTGRLAELEHIDLARVAISLCQTRKDVAHGIYASLTPLRFEAGAKTTRRRGRLYGVQPVLDAEGREYLYILSFYLPRFMKISLEEKLSTIVHELWHIGPDFDGDLRRHEGRCYAHGPSQQRYDALMDRLAQRWLALDPPSHCYDFLLGDCDELVAQYGAITGDHWPHPQLIPLSAA
jgi:predicted metallopeptidase